MSGTTVNQSNVVHSQPKLLYVFSEDALQLALYNDNLQTSLPQPTPYKHQYY